MGKVVGLERWRLRLRRRKGGWRRNVASLGSPLPVIPAATAQLHRLTQLPALSASAAAMHCRLPASTDCLPLQGPHPSPAPAPPPCSNMTQDVKEKLPGATNPVKVSW